MTIHTEGRIVTVNFYPGPFDRINQNDEWTDFELQQFYFQDLCPRDIQNTNKIQSYSLQQCLSPQTVEIAYTSISKGLVSKS